MFIVVTTYYGATAGSSKLRFFFLSLKKHCNLNKSNTILHAEYALVYAACRLCTCNKSINKMHTKYFGLLKIQITSTTSALGAALSTFIGACRGDECKMFYNVLLKSM